jgi:hypothetical protein
MRASAVHANVDLSAKTSMKACPVRANIDLSAKIVREGRQHYTPISTKRNAAYAVGIVGETVGKKRATQNGDHEGDHGQRKYGHVGEDVHGSYLLMTVELRPERAVPPLDANRNP